MSKRNLPALNKEHTNLMDHIADSMCKIANGERKLTNENLMSMCDLMHEWGKYLARFSAELYAMAIPHVKIEKDEKNFVKCVETDDDLGKLPLLTEDELQTLKQLLANYKHPLPR